MIARRIALVLGGLLAGTAVALLLGHVAGLGQWGATPHSINGMSAEQAAAWVRHPRFFTRDGVSYVSNHPHMARERFPADKPLGEFRVFLTGGSQALGDPYVHAAAAIAGVDTEALEIPNGGGIATWLQEYFEQLYPERTARVVNAAVGSQNLETATHVIAEILQHGEPDLVILVSGNNEAYNQKFASVDQFDRAVDRLTQRYAAQVARVVDLAGRHQTPIYLVTVASNLRDWLPAHALQSFGQNDTQHWLEAAEWQQAIDRFDEKPEDRRHALADFFRGRLAESRGENDEAYGYYRRAKDKDFNLIRAHSRWNDLLLAVDHPLVESINIEETLRAYAVGGIPGFDLFHDNCHYKLRANMLVARAIASAHKAIAGLPGHPLAELDLGGVVETSLRSLYAIKQAKWRRLQEHEDFDFLGDTNRENVAREFRRLEDDFRGIESFIEAYEAERDRGP